MEINTLRNYYFEMFKSFIEKFSGIISVEILSISKNDINWYSCRKDEAINTLKLEINERISKIKYNLLYIIKYKRCKNFQNMEEKLLQ
jgi:hypothetical protein